MLKNKASSFSEALLEFVRKMFQSFYYYPDTITVFVPLLLKGIKQNGIYQLRICFAA